MKKQPSDILDKENELSNGLMNNNDLAYETLVCHYSAKMYAGARRFFNLDDDAQECLPK